MNRMHTSLSLSFALLIPVSLMAESCTPGSQPSPQIAELLQRQKDAERTQRDVRAGVVYLLSRLCAPSKQDSLLGHLTSHASKVAVKEVASNALGNTLPDLCADLPLMGEVTIINQDQMLEVAYAVISCCMENRSGDALQALYRVYSREKVLQCVQWMLRELCGNDGCPMPEQIKSNWLISTACAEFMRMEIDKHLPAILK